MSVAVPGTCNNSDCVSVAVCRIAKCFDPPPLSLLGTGESVYGRLCVCCRAGYLQGQEVPMVVVSHDREFLDQLCNKLVETEFGVATSYKGNYTQYVKAKEEKIGQQWAAWEKQQKEVARQVRPVVSMVCIACNSV